MRSKRCVIKLEKLFHTSCQNAKKTFSFFDKILRLSSTSFSVLLCNMHTKSFIINWALNKWNVFTYGFEDDFISKPIGVLENYTKINFSVYLKELNSQIPFKILLFKNSLNQKSRNESQFCNSIYII